MGEGWTHKTNRQNQRGAVTNASTRTYFLHDSKTRLGGLGATHHARTSSGAAARSLSLLKLIAWLTVTTCRSVEHGDTGSK